MVFQSMDLHRTLALSLLRHGCHRATPSASQNESKWKF